MPSRKLQPAPEPKAKRPRKVKEEPEPDDSAKTAAKSRPKQKAKAKVGKPDLPAATPEEMEKNKQYWTSFKKDQNRERQEPASSAGACAHAPEAPEVEMQDVADCPELTGPSAPETMTVEGMEVEKAAAAKDTMDMQKEPTVTAPVATSHVEGKEENNGVHTVLGVLAWLTGWAVMMIMTMMMVI